MSQGYIRNCSWGYKCEKKWEALESTSISSIRFCGACEREVHRCDNRDDLVQNVLLNRCVYFESALLKDDNKSEYRNTSLVGLADSNHYLK